MSKPLRIGLVGTGYAAQKRAEAFQEDERSQLVFVTGHTHTKTLEFCQDTGAFPLETWQQLVTHPEIDLVNICTINRDHGAIARAALEAGKHVIIEYPLSLNPSEAATLIDLAQAQGKMLHVEHIELLGGLHQTIRQYLPQIGHVFYARYMTFSPQRSVAGRWAYNHQLFGFPFCAALSRIHRFTDLFGSVATVNGQSYFWETSDPHIYTACLCNAQLRFENGLIATITYGKGETFWKSDRTFELHGETGTLIFDGDRGTLIQGDKPITLDVPSRRGLFSKDTTLVLDHLFEKKPLYISPNSSLYALKVAEAIRQSSETGKTIQMSS